MFRNAYSQTVSGTVVDEDEDEDEDEDDDNYDKRHGTQ
jgi:hypothetical protein